ncbi:MAG: hypothetical protein JWO95_1724 [Verrucomicrobiales bacterium]|nr:hypothetical protein [Verrucomicrobiales bacterium]
MASVKRFACYLFLCLFGLNASAQLTATDVTNVVARAVKRARVVSSNSVIAVVDREGWVLAVWSVNGASPSLDVVANAISKAGTAAFLSSKQNAFSSRSAGFIIQQHFPPPVNNKPPGPLVGVEFSNLPFSDINKFKAPGSTITFGSSPGNSIVPVPGTSLAGVPGGLPLYKSNVLVGAIGVASAPAAFATNKDGSVRCGYPILPNLYAPYPDEDVALAGQFGFAPRQEIWGSHVFIDGIRVPYVNSGTRVVPGVPALTNGAAVAPYSIMGAPAAFPYPIVTLGGVTSELRQPIIDDPVAGTIAGQPRLTAAEVTNIIARAAARAVRTRAGIRLPRGASAAVFITVVNNPDNPTQAPTVLGTFRTPDATIFSWDVAIQKARTVIYYSTRPNIFAQPIAFSTRAVGFLAQSLYPPGIIRTASGPFYCDQEGFSGLIPSATPEPSLPNGITIFPGGFPLYRNGVLIGAIGVSGDGIDQDDLIAADGDSLFPAPTDLRADHFTYRGARLPYAKFPRNPAL